MDKSGQPTAFVFYSTMGSIKLNKRVIRYSSMRSMHQRLVNMHSEKLKARSCLELLYSARESHTGQ